MEQEAIAEKQATVGLTPYALRRGLSLTEVLIAMGILTVGLLGVLAVFPVGSFYMQKAEIADRGAAIAQSVMNDIETRGFLNPRTWFVQVPYVAAPGAPTSPNYFITGIDGKYAPVAHPAVIGVAQSTFTRPFAEALAEGLNRTADAHVLAQQFGHAYVLDPMFAAATATTGSNKNNVAGYAFPASSVMTFPGSGGSYYMSSPWDPWRAAAAKDKVWPIRRVTFQDSLGYSANKPGWPMGAQTAEHFFRGNDDLAIELPARDDRPAVQGWDVSGTVPLARQWTGDYSWIVSVVPTTNAARNGIATNPESFSYDVSVVVFYKRVVPTSTLPLSDPDMQDAIANERAVGAKVISTGLNGGELLLTDLYDVYDATLTKSVSPFDHLRTGQWIMLCGPHPNSATYLDKSVTPNVWRGEPRFVMAWYQVISIDKDGTGSSTSFDPKTQRVVAVRGPQWPWQPASDLTDKTLLSNDLCVGICRGAVAVHTKTLRLESSLGSSFGVGKPMVVAP